jgi:hypothetical protein
MGAHDAIDSRLSSPHPAHVHGLAAFSANHPDNLPELDSELKADDYNPTRLSLYTRRFLEILTMARAIVTRPSHALRSLSAATGIPWIVAITPLWD